MTDRGPRVVYFFIIILFGLDSIAHAWNHCAAYFASFFCGMLSIDPFHSCFETAFVYRLVWFTVLFTFRFLPFFLFFILFGGSKTRA